MPTDRRDFLSRLAAGLAVTAGVPAIAPAIAPASAEAAPAPGGAAPDFDDSWTRRLAAAKHKAVFDAAEPEEGLALRHARIYRDGYREALGVEGADVAAVVVLRHAATVLAFDDAIWAKYGVAKLRDVKDPSTQQHTAHNPFSRPHTDDERRRAGEFLEGLIASGVVVLACNLATRRLAGTMARQAGAAQDQVYAEVRGGLVPGVLLQPSGIYATARAQEVGCVHLRSS
jgi:hypothetical protein